MRQIPSIVHAHVRPRVHRLLLLVAALMLVPILIVRAPPGADAAVTTVSTDTLRTGWDRDEPGLSPASVTDGGFGQLFRTAIDGQVYAQPVVWGDVVLVATEQNQVYGIDAVSGAVRWQRSLGPAWPAAAISCGDLTPTIGVTSTPVVDPASGVAYLFSKTYDGADPRSARYLAHALQVANGNELPGWPVAVAGTAANFPAAAFDPFVGLQRTGLLLLDGVVYAGFASHCGATPSRGWVVGVSTSQPRLTTLWTSQASAVGTEGNIWQSGGGLVSDGPGRILLQTDDGGFPAVGPGAAPPANLGQSVVRLAVQADQSLRAVDFFTPYNVEAMLANGADLGSGGPAGLPAGFGNAAHPRLLVTAGKEGRVYLLDRDNLGGRGQAAGGLDLSVGEAGPYDGVWGHPAVWGGDGGWVYLAGVGPLRAYSYGLDGNGVPELTLAGVTSDRFGFGSGSPVVTSGGTTTGSALLWVVYSPDGSGVGAELRAYDPVPRNFGLALRWSAPIGQAAKFSVPATDGGRVYVGTRDGHVLGFGRRAAQAVTASPAPLVFGSTAVGTTRTATTTLTATTATTVSGVTTGAGPFVVTGVHPPLPHALAAGESVTVTVRFSPIAVGAGTGQLDVATAQGIVNVPLQGTGGFNGPHLSVNPVSVGFGTVLVDRKARVSETAVFTNDGTAPLTVTSVRKPRSPFSADGLPATGTILNPGDTVVVSLSFAPRSAGAFESTIDIATTAGTLSVALHGAGSTTPGRLTLTPAALDFGDVSVGSSRTAAFDIANTGGVAITVRLAKAPFGAFSSDSPLSEGTVLNPGEHRTQRVTFAPTTIGAQSASYILGADDGQGELSVALTGRGEGTAAPPSITIRNPLSNQVISGTIQVQASAQNASGVTYRVDESSENPLAYNAGTGLWSAALDPATVAAGSHNVTVTAAGSGGATAADRAWSVQFTGAAQATSTPTPPIGTTPTATPSGGPSSIAIRNPLSNQAYSGTIQVQAEGLHLQSASYSVDDGALVPMTRTTTPNGWSAPLDTASLANGFHNVDVVGTGTDGGSVADRAWNVQVTNSGMQPTPTATSAATTTPASTPTPTRVPVTATPTPTMGPATPTPTRTPTPTVALTTPSAPTNLRATRGGPPRDQRIDLTWTGSPGATGYVVQRSTTASFPTDSMTWDVAAGVTSYRDDQNLATGTTYYYRVAARGLSGSSPYSNITSTTTR